MRCALLASVALAVMAGGSLTSLPAAAAMPGFSPDHYPDRYDDLYEPPNPILRSRPRPQPEPKSAPKPAPKSALKPEPAKDVAAAPKGPLQIVVSIADQHVTLYANGLRVAEGPVSTGHARQADPDRRVQHHPKGSLPPFQSL